jgi:hypothetical protein
MKVLWVEVSITPKHFPVFMASDHCDLFDGEAGLEQSASGFVPEIMKVQVFYAQMLTASAKRGAN